MLKAESTPGAAEAACKGDVLLCKSIHMIEERQGCSWAVAVFILNSSICARQIA